MSSRLHTLSAILAGRCKFMDGRYCVRYYGRLSHNVLPRTTPRPAPRYTVPIDGSSSLMVQRYQACRNRARDMGRKVQRAPERWLELLCARLPGHDPAACQYQPSRYRHPAMRRLGPRDREHGDDRQSVQAIWAVGICQRHVVADLCTGTAPRPGERQVDQSRSDRSQR